MAAMAPDSLMEQTLTEQALMDQTLSAEESFLLDASPESAFDDLTLLAARICDAPAAFIALQSSAGCLVKSSYGRAPPVGAAQGAFGFGCDPVLCQAIRGTPDALLEISDTLRSPLWREHPKVCGAPFLRFMAGRTLINREGVPYGTLGVVDTEPKCLHEWQREALRVLAHQVSVLVDLRLMLRKHIEYENALEHYRQELENTLRKLS